MNKDEAERRFRALYERARPRLLAYALRRTASPEDAADVVAETFAIAWRRLMAVPEGEASMLWLYAVCRRVIANHRRRAGRRVDLTQQMAVQLRTAVCDPLDAGADAMLAADALHRLSEDEREILMLAGWEGLSSRQLALFFGCSPTAARIRLHRARVRLNAEMEQVGLGAKTTAAIPTYNPTRESAHRDAEGGVRAMNKIDRRLRTADPVRMAALEAVSSLPVFEELLEDIVATPLSDPSELTVSDDAAIEWLEPVLPGRHAQRGHRRPLSAAIAGVAAVLLVVVALAVESADNSGQRSSSTAVTGRTATTSPSAASPKWRLVGDITPSWRTVSGTGYEPGVFLACPTTTTCYADNLQQGVPGTLSEVEVTHDGGGTWQQSDLQDTLTDTTPLACVDADTCATLGIGPSGNATFLETSNGGASWASLAGPSQLTSSFGVTVLACTTAESCVALASDPTDQSGAALAFVTHDGGATWADFMLPTDFVPTGLQCVSAGLCVASGFSQSPDGSSTIPPGTVLYSSDDGETWATASVPPSLGPLGRISCADSADCVASFFGDDGSSSEILASTDGGQSWSAVTASGLPAAFVTGLSSATAAQCWAAGMARAASGGSDGSGGPIAIKLGPGAVGIVASSSDGGHTWQDQQLPQGVLLVQDITCPSDTSCYALAIQTPSSGSPAQYVLLADGS